MIIQRTLAAFAVPALLALVSTASQASGVDPRVTQLVKTSGAALHVSAMRSIHVLYQTDKTTAVGIAGTAEGWNEMGGARMTQTYSNPPLSGGNGWDGRDNWSLDQTGLVWVDGSDAGRANQISQAYLGNYDLWSKDFGGATVAWGGTKADHGTSYDVLTITAPDSKVPFDLWFDKTSHLPVRMVLTVGPVQSVSTFSDYRPVHGLMVPYSMQNDTQGNVSVSSITSVAVNPAGGLEHLRKPPSDVRDFSIANGETQTSIPIQLSENHVYLDVMLNGKGPYHFIFDTGGANVIDPAVAAEIGALGKGNVQIGGVGNTTESSSFATVDTLGVGDATVRNQVFTVVPVRKGFGITAGLPVDGLIGWEVLSRFITTFDYANNRVILQMPGTYTAPAGADVIPIVQNGTQPQFACSIDGVPTVCTVDTGARDSISLFGPFMKDNPQVVPQTLSASGVNGFGVGGPAIGQLGRLQTLSFGNETLQNIVGDFTSQTGGAFAMPFVGANVGGGVWKRYTMTLDYDKLTMTLTPNATVGAADFWDRSGLFLLNRGGVYTIADARPGTPAAKAGLVKGDAIVSVNGAATSTLTLKAVRDAFLGAPGTTVHLVVKGKDGATRGVTLTLADYV